MVKAVGLDINKPAIMQKSKGRILHQHAVMYILEGRGSFTDEDTAVRDIAAGDIFFQYPEKWHCFDPAPGTGWTEYWILFDGHKAESAFGPLIPSSPVHSAGIRRELADAYEELYDLWFYDSPKYEVYSAYLLHRILTLIDMAINRVSIRRRDDLIHRAKMQMKNSISRTVFDFRAFAEQQHRGYEALRKQFKKETGLAPNQYFLNLKISRAKERLLRPETTVKELAFELGLNDPYYFSRLFKKKTGLSPRDFRKHYLASSQAVVRKE